MNVKVVKNINQQGSGRKQLLNTAFKLLLLEAVWRNFRQQHNLPSAPFPSDQKHWSPTFGTLLHKNTYRSVYKAQFAWIK